MKKIMIVPVILFATIFFTACGKSAPVRITDTDTEDDDSIIISGAMQKGPFLTGSTLAISMLDSDGEAIGLDYQTVSEDDFGAFSTTVQSDGPSEFACSGVYFNEVADRLSDSHSPITLRAVYDISDESQHEVILNVFTHMSSGLVLKRMAEGETIANAIAYAENKLFEEIGIVHPLGSLQGNGTSMDLAGLNSPDNQYIVALSCVVAKTAELMAGDSSEVDEHLREMINDIRSQLENDEIISSEYKEYLREAESALNPIDGCVDNLADYIYYQAGEVVELPDPDQCLDNDHDGTVNAEDTDIDGDGIVNDDDEAPYNINIGGGMYFDYATNLAWENMPKNYKILWSVAKNYCLNLVVYGYDDWRMPAISELRTLVRDCSNTETGGECAVTDSCSTVSCFDEIDCFEPCPQGSGPAEPNNCYWLSDLGGECSADIQYWSYSVADDYNAWMIDFDYASIHLGDYTYNGAIRCVRDL